MYRLSSPFSSFIRNHVTHYDKLHALLESIIKKADYYNEEVRERYLKSINF